MKRTHTLLTVALLCAAANTTSACQFDGGYDGYVEIKTSAYKDQANLNDQSADKTTYRLNSYIECSSRFSSQSGIQVKLLADYDNSEKYLWFNPKELNGYYDLTTLPMTFVLGYQQKTMGYFEAEQTNSLYNPQDYQESIFQKANIGRFALGVNYQTEFWSLQADIMPVKQFDRWSEEEGRFRRTNMIIRSSQTDEQENNLSWQLRSDYINDDLELSLIYWRGLSPQAEIQVTQDSYPLAIDYHHHIDQLGLSFQYMFGGFSIKSDSYVKSIDSSTLYGFSFGINTYHYNILGSYADATFFFENYWLSGNTEEERLTNSFDNDIYLGARINLNNGKNANVELGLIHDYETSSLSLYTEFSQSMTDNWQLVIGAELYQPDNDDIKQISFENDSRLYINNQWYF